MFLNSCIVIIDLNKNTLKHIALVVCSELVKHRQPVIVATDAKHFFVVCC